MTHQMTVVFLVPGVVHRSINLLVKLKTLYPTKGQKLACIEDAYK